MKRLITGLLGTGLFLSLNSFAYSITPDCGNTSYGQGLCAPKFCGGFSIGVTGAWIRPTGTGSAANDLVLGRADDDFIFRESFLHRFDQDHEWEWGVNVGYDLPCTAYSAQVDYFHIDNQDHRHHNFNGDFASVGSFFVTNFFFPIGEDFLTEETPIVFTDVHTHSHLKYKFDQVDLKFGRQFNDVCGFFAIKPSVGVRYAKVDHHYHTRFDGTLLDAIADTPSPFIATIFNIHNHSEFDGIGPLAAIDTRYGFCGGFGIVGHADAALLVGNIDSHLSTHGEFSPFDPESGEVFFTEVDDARLNASSTDRVVASLSGKVGLDYSFCFCNKSSLTFEVGYQASKYFSAIELLRGNVEFSPTIVEIPLVTSQQLVTNVDTSDFDFRGPYLNVTWHI